MKRVCPIVATVAALTAACLATAPVLTSTLHPQSVRLSAVAVCLALVFAATRASETIPLLCAVMSDPSSSSVRPLSSGGCGVPGIGTSERSGYEVVVADNRHHALVGFERVG